MKPTHGDLKPFSVLRTIGEVAEQIDVPQYVLRFWESKFSQIAPEKHRGKRYYRPEDIVVLREIKTLLYEEKYTIKGVQSFLQQKSKNIPENKDIVEKEVLQAADKKRLQSILKTLRTSRTLLKKVLDDQCVL